MNRMEPPRRDPMADCLDGQASGEKLQAADDAVLPRDEFPEL
jgi:hypothetical protein